MAGGFKVEGEQDNGFEVRRAEGGHFYEIGVKIWGDRGEMDGRILFLKVVRIVLMRKLYEYRISN